MVELSLKVNSILTDKALFVVRAYLKKWWTDVAAHTVMLQSHLKIQYTINPVISKGIHTIRDFMWGPKFLHTNCAMGFTEFTNRKLLESDAYVSSVSSLNYW